MRRAKALFFSGCKPYPATFPLAGSNGHNRGDNETVEAFSVESPIKTS